MQCEEWDDANSELFKESHDEAVHKNSYKSRLYELISASLEVRYRIPTDWYLLIDASLLPCTGIFRCTWNDASGEKGQCCNVAERRCYKTYCLTSCNFYTPGLVKTGKQGNLPE